MMLGGKFAELFADGLAAIDTCGSSHRHTMWLQAVAAPLGGTWRYLKFQTGGMATACLRWILRQQITCAIMP